MSNFLIRPASVEPPLAVKIGVGLQAVWLMTMLVPARSPSTATWVLAAVQGVLLFGAWNMKRWAVAALIGVVVLTTLLALPMLDWSPGRTGHNVFVGVFMLLWRLLLLSPILASWRIMTWT